MLSHILIRDFAIIERLELDLSSGMTALTGETGAGKSILIDAIGLVLGDRADSTAVRAGADKAEISVTFDLAGQADVLRWLREQDLDPESDTSCTVRRIITQDGRSRAYVAGSPAPLQTLKALGERLVDIHGQHAHQSLLHRDTQRGLLDLQADQEDLLGRLLETHRQWSALRDAIETAEQDGRHRQERLDLVEFQVGELEAADPKIGEIGELEEEHQRLSNANLLLEAAQSAYAQLYESDPDAHSLVTHALSAVEQAAGYDNQLAAPLELLRNAQIEIQEAASALRHYLEDLNFDPVRLEELDIRLALLQSLARKHRCQPDELPERLQSLAAERDTLLDHEGHRSRLTTEIEATETRYRKLAGEISHGRRNAAQALGHAVTEAMQTLGMAGGRFEIGVTTNPTGNPSPHGLDQVEYLVSANPGQPLRPLAKVASGGELSRISLALQLAATRDRRLPTLIFDEVDSGIGGGTAEVVGRMLRTLGGDRQILCVTHLPQVAAQAHSQLAVRKVKGADVTETRIEPLLTDPARIEELARMLGGVQITARSQAHAEEMLKSARQE